MWQSSKFIDCNIGKVALISIRDFSKSPQLWFKDVIGQYELIDLYTKYTDLRDSGRRILFGVCDMSIRCMKCMPALCRLNRVHCAPSIFFRYHDYGVKRNHLQGSPYFTSSWQWFFFRKTKVQHIQSGGFLKESPYYSHHSFALSVSLLLRRLADIRRFRLTTPFASTGRSAMTSATNKSTPAQTCRKSCTDRLPTIPEQTSGGCMFIFFSNES